MPTDPPPIQIDLTPRFQRDLRDLAKRYRQVRADLQSLIEQLQAGELPGDRMAGVNYTVFKVRLKKAISKKAKVAVIESSITSKLLIESSWQRSTPNPISLMLTLK